MRVITSTNSIWGPNLLLHSIQRRVEAVPWLGQLDYSANSLGLTSAFHWTSARCSSFRFRAAWRSPRGKGAAACCRHGPREEAAGVHYVSATNLVSLHPYFSAWACLSTTATTPRRRIWSNMARYPEKELDCSWIYLQRTLADALLFASHLGPTQASGVDFLMKQR